MGAAILYLVQITGHSCCQRLPAATGLDRLGERWVTHSLGSFGQVAHSKEFPKIQTSQRPSRKTRSPTKRICGDKLAVVVIPYE
ncbi:hypothetical protein BV22DRAFT_1028506 [Leucogyrophana mollusca]|uniref:Uncharacterized protein n=1 Tax=Leucogyrophana mollusca TaxID=85980 RepID=A0ACB8BXI0_9AGAM|nr:hypothetical protein BV22DRAFT_1028506 [Leucogyrophana mollusca]